MTDSTAGPRRHRSALVVVGAAVLLIVAFLVAGKIRAGSDTGTRACAWNANVSNADRDQAGLIRCYLKALAQHSESGLRSVARPAETGGPTEADFAHSADANSGPATVTVKPNDSDSAAAMVEIQFANGAHDEELIALADPDSSHSWRFVIGTLPRLTPQSGVSAPPSAAPGSSTP